ncbi:MAG: oligosaccharide flippase family protein [Candidatus Woesearchaeota archaeon]|nr:MAG: oligosaccharide flippase family protein [Candidatus Woesearchaeota archaeon]
MDYAKNAVKRTALVFTISIIAAFIGFLVRLVLARELSPEDYGLLFSIFTLITFLTLFRRVGLLQTIVKFIPEFQVKKKPDLIKNAIVIVLGINLILSIIISVILITSSNFLAKNYFRHPLAEPVLIIFSFIFIASVFKMTLRYIFNAFQKMDKFSLMYLAENFLILLFILLFFKLNIFNSPRVFLAAIAYLITYILLFFIFVPFFLKIYPFFKYKFKFSSKLSKKLIKFGILVMISGIGNITILYTDTLVLTYFSNLREVGIYNVLVPTAMLLDFFGRSVSQVIMPMVSELWAKKLKEYVNKGVLLLQRYALFAIIPLATVMFSFPELLIKVLFGNEYISGAFTLQLLVIGMIFFIIASINMNILKAIGKPFAVSKVILTGALFNLITNFYFIPKYGIVGAGLTSLISYFLILLISIIYLKRSVKLKFPLYDWLKLFFSGVIMALLMIILKAIIDINVYAEALVVCLLGGATYLTLAIITKAIDIETTKNFIKNIYK